MVPRPLAPCQGGGAPTETRDGRRSEIHKRLMLYASVAIIGAADYSAPEHPAPRAAGRSEPVGELDSGKLPRQRRC